jgi:hypothetical protein
MKKFMRYCPEHYTEIENYYEALKDDFIGWHCHHIKGETHTKEFLLQNNLYYDRTDPTEFKFMREEDHISLHKKRKKLTKEHIEKIRKSNTGKKHKGHCDTEFCLKFKEHFNLALTESIPVELKQTYKNEHKIYKRNGVCRWEKEYRRTAWNKGKKLKKSLEPQRLI